MKISRRTVENFRFYGEWLLRQGPIGPAPFVVYAKDGVTAIEAFAALDNRGESLPCCQDADLKQALWGKASLNAQIKMWSEYVADRTFTVVELVDALDWLPDWVWTAVRNQAARRVKLRGNNPWPR